MARLASLLAGAPGTEVSLSEEHVTTDSWFETRRSGSEKEVMQASGRCGAIRLVRTMRMRTPVLLAAEVIDWVSVATGVVLKATHGHKAGLRLPDRDLVITRLNRRG